MVTVVVVVDMVVMVLLVERNLRTSERKIGLGLGSAKGAGGGVVSAGGFLCRAESAEPHARLLPRISDFCCKSAPWSFSDASKSDLFALM